MGYDWTFGDGAIESGGATVSHTYAKPGTFHASLTVTAADGKKSTVAHDVTAAAPKLQTDVSFVDAHGAVVASVSPKLGESVSAKLTLTTTNGVGPISDISFADGGPLVATPGAAASIGAPSMTVPSPLTLQPNTSFATTFPVRAVGNGLVKLTSTPSGKDAAGNVVTGTVGQRSFAIPGLTVALSVDPSKFTMKWDANGPIPVDVTVTEKITNATGGLVTSMNLRSLEPQRVVAGSLMNVVYKSGPHPDPVLGEAVTLPDGGLPDRASVTLTAVYTVKDASKVDFTSLVTAADANGATVRGLGSTRLEADPKYVLQVHSHVVRPQSKLLPAGSAIVISGTVTNMTATSTETVPPLYPRVAGNAGLSSFTWDAAGADPKALTSAAPIMLDPGASRDFTVKVLTAYSEPVVGASPLTTQPSSGGTSATVTFTPWVQVTRDDGTVYTTDTVAVGQSTGDILSTDAELSHRISIDDSIALPQDDALAVVGGFYAGTIQGIWNGASGMVTGLIGLPKVSASTLFAITQYQDAVWKSFDAQQRQEMTQSTAQLVASVLYANYSMAKQGLPALVDKANAAALKYYTDLENESKTGSYANAVEKYSALSSDAVSQVMLPIALGKLATSRNAVRVVEAAQQARDATAARITGSVTDAATVEQAFSSLTKIPAGVNLAAADIARLYGITETELSRLQALSDKYKFLLVVRSRAASSINWIRDFAAMLKPEAFKIKSVSELDVQLGYPAKFEGALVFKQPTPLIEFQQSGGDLEQLTKAYVEKQGFTAGTAGYDNAISRMNLRIKEWNKWNATYQKWAKQKWVDASFNWRGNYMRDPNVTGSGRFPGFTMEPIGGDPTTLEMKMYNPKTGTYVPITGDIDPIAFTHVDGTPLTREEHAALLNEMRLDPALQSQHGESATYVDGGVDFIASQFAPNEAGLMIGPGQHAPRTVRFNKAFSIWKSPADYHLAWDGGFVSTGANPPSTASLTLKIVAGVAAASPTELSLPVPGDGTPDSPNVGRCAITYNATATPTFMTNAGSLGAITGTTISPSALESTCFTAGPVVPVQVAPTTITPTKILSGQTEIPINPNYSRQTGNNGGFQIGQTVQIAPGTPQAETGTISGFGSIILRAPVKYDHPAGTVIVTIAAAPAGSSTSTTPRTVLAATGTDITAITNIGAGALLMGLLLTASARRRRTFRHSVQGARVSRG